MNGVVSIDQRRAQFAWECLDKVKPGDLVGIATRVKGAPAMVAGNGLMPALAFWTQKKDGDTGYAFLAKSVSGWLGKTGLLLDQPDACGGAVLERLVELDSSGYRRATTETLAFLRWLRQLASAKAAAKSGARRDE